MTFFQISETDVKSLDGKVAIITGVSSGIGLATAELFLSKGATVVGGDLQQVSYTIDSPKFSLVSTDVTSWADLCKVFEDTYNKHGRIDIVFANAGVAMNTDFLNLQVDSNKKLQEPSKLTNDINLVAVTNQLALALHYMQQQTPKGGNIILTASIAGYERFCRGDYTVSKHGVIGLLRSMAAQVTVDEIPVRINAIAPSWTRTGMVPFSEQDFENMGIISQTPQDVARSVGLLATDEARHGQSIYSRGGQYVEMEEPMNVAMLKAIGMKGWAEEEERQRMAPYVAQQKAKGNA